MAEIEAWFPEKLRFLFQPSRYKVVRGGRGSGKSWGFARALLLLGTQRPLRVLCTREVQKSIAQSVHQLLRDQVEALGLGAHYEVLQNEIRGPNGTLFVFSGLSDQTAASLKSFEGIDVCWCEEAQDISKRSWEILVPTIRKNDSEIWVSFNPQLESDETFRRFVSEPPPGCVSIEMNYCDNRKFPAVLEAERLHAKATMPEADYLHIWEGKCRPAVEGAIYFDQIAQAEAQGRIREVPYDPLLKVHAVWDLGWNDAMAIILVQRAASELRLIQYIEGSHRTLSDYVMDLKALPFNWGHDYLPHDGFAKDYKTGKSAEEILRGMGRLVSKTPDLHVENGIKAAREVFARCYFAKQKTERLVECLKRYRRAVSKTTNEPGAPLHDEYSHGADAFRYLSLVADQLTNAGASMAPIKYPTRKVIA